MKKDEAISNIGLGTIIVGWGCIVAGAYILFGAGAAYMLIGLGLVITGRGLV